MLNFVIPTLIALVESAPAKPAIHHDPAPASRRGVDRGISGHRPGADFSDGGFWDHAFFTFRPREHRLIATVGP